MSRTALDAAIAEAVIGIDTLWGGDVMNPSGVGRFIADCWFSDEPLPRAYSDPTAATLRTNGGVGAKVPDRAAVAAYTPQAWAQAVREALTTAASGQAGR